MVSRLGGCMRASKQENKILIVDDNPAVCKFLEHFLRSQAFETVTAGDGQTALEKLMRCQPDWVLPDGGMRGRNG